MFRSKFDTRTAGNSRAPVVVSVPPASEVPPPWCLRFRLACCLLPAPPAPVAQEGAGHLYSFTRGCVASAPRQAGGNRPFPCHPLRGTYSDGCLGLSTFQCKHLFSNLQNAISQCYCLDENNCCGGGVPWFCRSARRTQSRASEASASCEAGPRKSPEHTWPGPPTAEHPGPAWRSVSSRTRGPQL